MTKNTIPFSNWRTYLRNGVYLFSGLKDTIIGAEGLTVTRPIELDGCTDVILRNVVVDCRHRIQIGVTVGNCTNCTIQNVQALNAVTLNDHGGEGHGFQVLHSHHVNFAYCASTSQKAGEMEDHFSVYDSERIGIYKCSTKGNVRTTGSAVCIDEHSMNCIVDNCVCEGGPIVIADGTGHVIDSNTVRSPQDVAIRVSNEWYNGEISATLRNNNLRPQSVYVRKDPRVRVTQN